MSAAFAGLPPDLVGFDTALATQDDALPFTWEAIRDVVYGMLAAQTRAVEAMRAACGAKGQSYRTAAQAAIEHLDHANMLGYAFAEGEFHDIAKDRGFEPDDQTYDGFVNQRMEHATDEEIDDAPER